MVGYSLKAPVAQLDRVTDFESAGRTFESCRARQIISKGCHVKTKTYHYNIRIRDIYIYI